MDADGATGTSFNRRRPRSKPRGFEPTAVRDAAERRRRDLDGAGIEHEIDAIVADLDRDGLAKSGRKDELRAELLAYFRDQLAQRTPSLVARAVGFRTQRQTLASDLDLRAVARSFFVDLMQATLAATYRTGAWPRRFPLLCGTRGSRANRRTLRSGGRAAKRRSRSATSRSRGYVGRRTYRVRGSDGPSKRTPRRGGGLRCRGHGRFASYGSGRRRRWTR